MKKVDDVDWSTWIPKDRATLLFVIRDGHVLLIHKKLGLGAGKINGPGGRIEAGETPLECAVREVQEEVCVTPTDVRPHGELFFQFLDGHSIHGHVFSATDCEGEAQETAEAIPIWTPLNAIPYEKMWEDDRYWFPLVLEGKSFSARFIIDGDRVADYRFD